jgi:hypothetical protein
LTVSVARERATRRHFPLLAVYATSILVSAALLFMVQPMFTKMVLPRFGGAPSVWSVAMVFFQGALLAGYAFAHLLTLYAPGRRSVLIHLAVMICAVFVLPISIATGWDRPPADGQALWLIGLFTISIGLPFFALAANSPLLQAWFARTDHPAAKDPYFLYVASNIGSFLALVTYPVLVEPFIRLSQQTILWSIGFGVLIVLIAGCGALLWRSPARETAAVSEAAVIVPSWRDAGAWIVFAAVPSGLLVAVTAYVSTDVAAIPLLWVLPLALYLLTFVITFAQRPIIPHWVVVSVQPVFVVAGLVAILGFDRSRNILWIIPLHATIFFVCALMCHGELARMRPAAKYLTSFYLWISVGGVVGGIATGLLAPYLFNWIAEYPILLALAALCRPGWAPWRSDKRSYFLYGAIAVVACLFIVKIFVPMQLNDATFWAFSAVLVASVLFWRSAFAAGIALILMIYVILPQGDTTLVRSFFGVSKITDIARQFRVLSHGTTLHGAQRIRNPAGRPTTGRPELLLYYWDGSAISQTFDAVRARVGGPIRYAVIGLGAGSLACRAGLEDIVHYYEIDPAIVRIARDPSLFTFLSQCRPDVPITIGDARLTLAEAPDGFYDLIVLDAFSSDAIPTHLLTREAMGIYLQKLRPHGMVVLHISNRHLELASVVAGIAADNAALTRVKYEADLDGRLHPLKLGGTVAAVVRREEDFGPLARTGDWELKAPDPNQWVWTDDYSNIVGSVLRQWHHTR